MTKKTYIKWQDLEDTTLQEEITAHLRKYSDYLTHNGIKTPYLYTHVIQQLLITQNTAPNNIKPEHVDKYLQSLEEKHLHRSALNTYISRIRKWLRYNNIDFADFIQIPTVRTAPPYDTTPTTPQITKLQADELKEYIEHLRTFGRTQSSINTFSRVIKIFQAITRTTTPNLTEQHILRFIKTLRDRQLKPSSINHYRTITRLFLKYHKKDDLYINVPPIKQTSPLKKTAPYGHVSTLIQESQKPQYPRWLHPLLNLISFTGIRIGSIAQITPDQLDLQDGWITFWTKGQKEQRLPLNDHLTAILSEYLRTGNNTTYLFPNRPTSTKPLDAHKIRYWLRKLSQQTRLPYYSPHAYRRAIATYLYYKSKENILFVKTFLNHTNIQTTIRYIDIDYDTFKNTYDTLSKELLSSLFPSI